MEYFAGIEGGGSVSECVILNSEGQELARLGCEGTNVFSIGIDTTIQRLVDVIRKAKQMAGIQDVKLRALGCSLSGAEEDSINNQLKQTLMTDYPDLSQFIFVTSDAVGTILSAVKNDGIILIAGTGSSCRLLNADGSVVGCGGWAHMIGDGGSAVYLSLQAVRTVFNHEDALEICPFDVSYVQSKMFEYFGVETKLSAMLDHLYGKWDRATFGGFAKHLAQGAAEGDQLCQHLFYENGMILGRHVLAVARKADKSLLDDPLGLPVVIVGSVWKSFEYMRTGFLNGLRVRSSQDAGIKRIRLLQCQTQPSVAMAAYVYKLVTKQTLKQAVQPPTVFFTADL